MANLGMADSLILMVMALVVFGPRRLPQIGRQIGKLMYEFRKASNDFKFQMEEELRTSEEADRRKKEEDRLRALAAATPAQPALSETASHDSEARGETTAAPQTAEVNLNDPATSNELMAAENIDGRGRLPVKLEAPIDESYPPRIMPPSTGEQVAASRPHGLTPLAQAATESGSLAGGDAEIIANTEPAPAGQPATVPAAMEQSATEPEQAAHHG
jgi:sec-independent protein translocase protein TatB